MFRIANFIRELDHPTVVAPRRKDKQRLGQRIHRRMQHEAAQLFGERRSARLARRHHVQPARAQQIDDRGDMRALAGAVDAFKSDEFSLASRQSLLLRPFSARRAGSG